MADGSSRHLTYFDQLAKDVGYAGGIETDMKDMVSSHRVKRFFKAFAWTRIFLFRRLLQTLFIWRLKIKQPNLIELGIDTMVMDNDDAGKRHGVKPTYKFKAAINALDAFSNQVDAFVRGGVLPPESGQDLSDQVNYIIEILRFPL